jgi:D-beta-D-heptose 7-phosphate kinase/D-beta-D-heptose 1-phosphate adenosyltransferase
MSRVLVAARASGIPVLVDPKIPHIGRYRGADLVTPNHREAEIATHCRIRTSEEARVAAREFQQRVGCRSVLITRGEHGMWLLDGTGTQPVEADIPAAAREVADVTGAGDTVIATFALSMAAGATLLEAAQLANVAAGVVVGKFGPAVVTPEELAVSVNV